MLVLTEMDVSEAAITVLQIKLAYTAGIVSCSYFLISRKGAQIGHSRTHHARRAALADEPVSLLSGVASVALTETQRPT